MRRSLVARLVVAFAVVGLGGAILTALVVHVAFGSRFADYVSTQQRTQANQLVAVAATSYRSHHGWDPAGLANLFPDAVMAGVQVEVFNVSGRPVWSSGSGSMAAMHRQMIGAAALGPVRDLPVVAGGSRVGTAEIRFTQTGPTTPDRTFAASVERSVALAGLGAGLMAVIVGVVLARRVTAPVRDLTRAARALAGGQRSARLQPSSPDELGEMASAFNAMADAIDTEERLRSDFARDVAHELRTPLMILQSQIEALQDGLAEPIPASLGSLHDETLRLGRLVADLETLASAAGTSFSMEDHVVDLSDLVGGAVGGFANPMRDAGLTVLVDAADDVAVVGDPTRLRQVVTNLVSNAAKFVPSGGTVRIDVRNDDGSAVLVVADNGPGIAPAELGAVFDRFYRGTGARASGSGIGLSVVSDIVAAHRGEVTVASELGQGARFTVRLPQATRHAHRDFAGSSRPTRNVISS